MKTRIAIPTNDRKTLFNRTGRAAEFAFFDIENGKIVKQWFAENPHTHDHDDHDEHDHEHGEHSHQEVMQVLKGCNVLLVKHLGKYMKADLQRHQIAHDKARGQTLNEIVENYIAKNS